MALRLKILMTFGSKKGAQITCLISQKSRQMNPLQVPKWGPYEERRPFTGHLHISQRPHLSGSPVKEPSLKAPLMESLSERCCTTRALFHSSVKVPGVCPPPPPNTSFPSTGKGPPWREMPASRDFPNISTRAPSEGAPPPQAPSQTIFRESDALSTETPSSLSR
jgi:hypothetical protein